MRKKKSTQSKRKDEPVKREVRLTCLLSEQEQRIVNAHLKKYGISNRSRWMRETLLISICKKMEDDYPTLFNESEMRR